jgi:hypothetical protein
MAEKKIPAGSVVCHDWTDGRKAPVTVSKLERLDIGAYVGRQELAVYLLAMPFFLLGIMSRGIWWPLLSANTGMLGTALGSIFIVIGIPFLVGMFVSMKGIKTRDLPKILMTISLPTPKTPESKRRRVRRRNVVTVLPDKHDV